LQKNGLSWSDYGGLNQIMREQLSPQSPVNKKGPRWGMPAYAPTAKEREIVEKARLRDAPQEWSRQYAMLGLILAS